MNNDRHACILYILCTNTYIQIELHVSQIIPCLDILSHVYVHICLELAHTLYLPSTYIECTSTSLYVHRTQKQKDA